MTKVRWLRCWGGALVLMAAVVHGWAAPQFDIRTLFADPPLRYAPRPLWFWNNTPVAGDGIAVQMRMARDRCGYGGFGILPFGEKFRPTYLSEDYFKVYGEALAAARDLGMTMCLYDEYGFPSGSAGAMHGDGVARFAAANPEHTIKRLDKVDLAAGATGELVLKVPEGRLMSVVAMEEGSFKRIDLTGRVADGLLKWVAPEGSWKVMAFVCVRDGDPNVDYLDPEAVKRYVAMTHQQYFDRFREYFGNTIDGSFFDETTMYRARGRMWTGDFNQKFKARHGFDPAPYYPALWMDIGSDTAAARNYLFGFRSDLYAAGYPKVVQDWCADHGIRATGHQDQEEVVNPVSVSGDLMKCFKHLAVPGIDKIGGNRPAERFYKVVSSAAYNWDRPLVMSETYGAMGDLEWDGIYRVAMEQYTKGINQLIPHAVWYDDANVAFKPELSWRHPKYAAGLKDFNRYLSRLNLMLQNDGRHVADVAVLYPIATLQGGHYLDGSLGHYKGGVEIPEADYVDVGVMLTDRLGCDFTYLHPEVLDERCVVEAGCLKLGNARNHETYRVLVLPGHRVISWSNLQKIKAFYDQGGAVIATGMLPDKSAEFGHDADVVRVIREMFSGRDVLAGGADGLLVQSNPRGGRIFRLPVLNEVVMRKALGVGLVVPDLRFEEGKELRYIHKIVDGRHVVLLANLGATEVDTWVEMRGHMVPEFWDPHDGRMFGPGVYSRLQRGGVGATRFQVKLAPGHSVFVLATELKE